MKTPRQRRGRHRTPRRQRGGALTEAQLIDELRRAREANPGNDAAFDAIDFKMHERHADIPFEGVKELRGFIRGLFRAPKPRAVQINDAARQAMEAQLIALPLEDPVAVVPLPSGPAVVPEMDLESESESESKSESGSESVPAVERKRSATMDSSDEDGSGDGAAAAAAPERTTRTSGRRRLAPVRLGAVWVGRVPLQKRKSASSLQRVVAGAVIGKSGTYGVRATLELNRGILPFLLRNFERGEEGTRMTPEVYAQLYTGKLTEAIVQILGKRATEVMKTTEGGLRKAFEWTPAQTQCGSTIGEVKEGTACWICSLAMTKEDITPTMPDGTRRATTGVQCEHKLPVVLALLITGLYDTKLLRVLRNIAYVKEVQKEYAWAHERCNQVKGETSYINDAGEGETVTLTLNRTAIDGNLVTIFSGTYPKFIPNDADFRTRASASAWAPTARASIAAGLGPILEQVNEKAGLTKSRLYAYFARAIVARARIAYGVQANPKPMKRVRPEMRPAIRAAKRARVEELRPAGGTRRVVRGGAENEEFDALLDETMDYVRGRLIDAYEIELEAKLAAIPEGGETEEAGWAILNSIDEWYGGFPVDVLEIAGDALEFALAWVDYEGLSDEEIDDAIDTQIERYVTADLAENRGGEIAAPRSPVYAPGAVASGDEMNRGNGSPARTVSVVTNAAPAGNATPPVAATPSARVLSPRLRAQYAKKLGTALSGDQIVAYGDVAGTPAAAATLSLGMRYEDEDAPEEITVEYVIRAVQVAEDAGDTVLARKLAEVLSTGPQQAGVRFGPKPDWL